VSVVRFPPRHRVAVFVTPEPLGAWYAVLGSHGWLFGSFHEAVAEAQELARLFGVPVRIEGRT
jgi:hypothetical protein